MTEISLIENKQTLLNVIMVTGNLAFLEKHAILDVSCILGNCFVFQLVYIHACLYVELVAVC